MKRFTLLVLVMMFTAGCARQPAQKDILAKINNYEITKEEFYDEFKVSPYVKDNTLEAKKEFLDSIIERKLIIQDAQKKELDTDKDFLKMIQRFWEQSLLKLAIEKKVNEVAVSSSSGQQKTREVETRILNDWVSSLKKKADIKVNYNLLK